MEAVMKIKEGGNTRKKACRFFTLRDHTSMSKADKSALARANFFSARLSRIAGIRPSCRLPLMSTNFIGDSRQS
jgi:hypothetical protein